MIQTQKVQKEKGDFDRNNPVIHDPNTKGSKRECDFDRNNPIIRDPNTKGSKRER